MKYKNINELKECPYCGCKEYYQRERITGETVFYMRFDGTEGDNTDLYEGLENKIISVFAYCAECEKRIARLDQE